MKKILSPLLIAFSLFFCTAVFAQNLGYLNRYSDIHNVETIKDDKIIQQQLKKVLGHDYYKFQANFILWPAPVILKDGGIMINGARSAQQDDLNHSLFLIDDKGNFLRCSLTKR